MLLRKDKVTIEVKPRRHINIISIEAYPGKQQQNKHKKCLSFQIRFESRRDGSFFLFILPPRHVVGCCFYYRGKNILASCKLFSIFFRNCPREILTLVPHHDDRRNVGKVQESFKILHKKISCCRILRRVECRFAGSISVLSSVESQSALEQKQGDFFC